MKIWNCRQVNTHLPVLFKSSLPSRKNKYSQNAKIVLIKNYTMKTTITLLLLFLTISIYSQQTFNIEDYKVKILNGKIINTEPLMDPTGLLFHDSLILIRNYQTEFHFDLLNLKDGTISGNFIKKGRGPGEIIYPMNFQIIPENNEFLVYDLNKKNINFYSLDAILQNNPDNFSRSVRIDSAYARYTLSLDDGTYLCPLIGDKVGYKYFTLDANEKFNRFEKLLPDVGKDYPPLVSSNLFNYWIGINATKEKVVLAYDHWDRLDIIQDVSTIKEITIKGAKHKIPEYVVSGGNLTLISEKAIFAYCSPCAGEKSFIVLYSGEEVFNKEERKMTLRNYKKALHFNYDGKLIDVFNLNPGVQYITVDWDNKIIYGVNKELEPILYSFKF